MLPKLRKSLQKHEKGTNPVSVNQKASCAIEAPRAVIKALYDYTQASEEELSFSQGDFFHVVGNDDDEEWFDACNPATGARGLVPVQYFQLLGRKQKEPVTAKKTAALDYVETSRAPSRAMSTQKSSLQPSKTAPLYGIVQYDFQAERPDELDAKAGEAIIIIAQSNHEWFVAKPIGRLGGPGLIPVSFIEIRDMATGRPIGTLEEQAAKAAVPKVEEWKKAAAEYKNSSIPLGRFDFDRKSSNLSNENIPHSDRTSKYRSNTYPAGYGMPSDALFVVKASVDQFLLAGSRYWFLVRIEMNDGRHRNLCRFYEDFYDFQIALLEEFPVEAGRTGEQRILPFMPGPLTYVDDTISAQRRTDLNVYVEELCRLPPHIVHSRLIQNLFAAREGDVESSHPTSMMPQPIYTPGGERMRTSGQSQNRESRANQNNSRQSERAGSIVPVENNSQPRTSGQTVSDGTAVVYNKDNATNFLKIKIFYQEDLIALRVPSTIDYTQLRGKLRERLSTNWKEVSYRDVNSGMVRQITNDEDLRHVLETTDKVVLYVTD